MHSKVIQKSQNSIQAFCSQPYRTKNFKTIPRWRNKHLNKYALKLSPVSDGRNYANLWKKHPVPTGGYLTHSHIRYIHTVTTATESVVDLELEYFSSRNSRNIDGLRTVDLKELASALTADA